jgi:hypothetical protein
MTSFAVISHFFIVHTDRVITHVIKHPSSFSVNEGGSECKPPTVAVLISGQFSRFVFKENEGPLVTSSSWWGCGEPTVDVYIVLHRGEPAKPWIGQISAPPYINDNVTIAEIKQYYLEHRNATLAHIKVVRDHDMLALDMQLLDTLFSWRRPDPSLDKLKYDLFHEKMDALKGHDKLFKTFYRVMYLRHLAYVMSKKRKSYDVFIRLREDAFFFKPLNLAEIGYNISASIGPHYEKAYVSVEKWCKFRSYSDKFHIGNDAGMAALFGNDHHEFLDIVKRSMIFRLERRYFQPEAFLQTLLSDANVHEVDVNRIDLRYVGLKRCVPWIYYKCLPDSAKAVLSELDILNC